VLLEVVVKKQRGITQKSKLKRDEFWKTDMLRMGDNQCLFKVDDDDDEKRKWKRQKRSETSFAINTGQKVRGSPINDFLEARSSNRGRWVINSYMQDELQTIRARPTRDRWWVRHRGRDAGGAE